MAGTSAIKAKICGITSQEALDTCAANGAAYVGFVYFPASPRHIAPDKAAALKVSPGVKTVYVMVNPAPDDLQGILRHFQPDYFQLHGKESPEDVVRVKETISKAGKRSGIIKAISVRSGDDIAKAHAYTPHVDMLLFDAKPPAGGLPGGNGLSFDWALLKDRSFDKPWFLSGGLSEDNVEEAVRLSGAQMVDVSSSVESAPGIKDPKRIQTFLSCVSRIRL